jgi:heterodisulfide reductase subunit A
VDVPNEFNDDFNTRKAIYQPYPLPNPITYTLDIETCTKCGRCVEICPTDAIDLKAKERKLSLSVGSVILATGLQVFDPKPYMAYGYGSSPNILTSIDFERIYSGIGPFSGERTIVRPSDKKPPKNLAFIQCVGSRNTQYGHEYCSYACCMYSLKEALLAKEQNPEMDVTIYFMDMRAFGKGYHRYYEQAKVMGINFVRCRIPSVQKISDTDNLELTIVAEDGDIRTEEFELVVLSVGLEAQPDLQKLAKICKLNLSEYNYIETQELSPLLGSQDGIYVCGGATGPKDIPDSITEASAAAALAASELEKPKSELDNENGKAVDDQKSETSMGLEAPRFGILICGCGNEITDKLRIDELEEYCRNLSGVSFVKTVEFLCIHPEEIETVLENNIDDTTENTPVNRLIIAACAPYRFETVFKTHARSFGLKPESIELINLRDRLSATEDNKDRATALVKDQLEIAHEKLNTLSIELRAITEQPVTSRALILGGGLAGMTCALAIANNGLPVDLIEQAGILGGHLNEIHSTLLYKDVPKFLKQLIKSVNENKNITVRLNSTIQEVTGYVGNFQTLIKGLNDKKPEQVEYGAILIATGAKEYTPVEYLYGKVPQVLTSLEFESFLSGKELGDKDKTKFFKAKSDINTIAMIQCVGSRDETHPYCSRLCCLKALKNAINFKQKQPKSRIYILYQDVMTYGLSEKYYLQALATGIEFIRYDPGTPPRVERSKNSDKVLVKINDELLNQELTLEPDLLVLSTGVVPENTGLETFDQVCVEYTEDGFLKEANVKFRPVDMLTDGIFICGLAHSPRQISESIISAQAAAGRALTILNKQSLPIRSNVSEVNARRCSGCEACISACPYHARVMDADEKIATVLEPLCQGCGVCAMVCPNAAARIKGLKREQIYSMIDAAVD